jgi:hypothetical protein
MSSRRFKSPFKSHFSIERLEDRQMMAGDVFARVEAGTLIIEESGGTTGQAQAVQVRRLANGKVMVSGFVANNDPDRTKVLDAAGNDLGVAEFSGVTNVRIALGDGADTVVMNSQETPFRYSTVEINTAGPTLSQNDGDRVFIAGFKVDKKLDIRTGAGNDVIDVSNVEVILTSGTGQNFTIDSGIISSATDTDRDTVSLDGVTARCFASINTGASADTITIKRSMLGLERKENVLPQATMIFTGAGADVLKMGSDGNDLNVVGVRGDLIINTGHDSQDEVDKVQMRDIDVDESIFVDLGGGGDQLEMINILARKNIELLAKKGNDTAILSDVEAFDNFFADMGEGSDTLNITFVKAQKVDLNGGDGDGYDKLFLQQSPNIPTLIRRGFEEINGKKLINKPVVPSTDYGTPSKA